MIPLLALLEVLVNIKTVAPEICVVLMLIYRSKYHRLNSGLLELTKLILYKLFEN